MKLVTLKDQRLGRVEDDRIIPFDFSGGMLPSSPAPPTASARTANRRFF